MSGKPTIAAILLASGHSARFSGNKLTAEFAGHLLVDAVLDALPAERFRQVVVVTRYPEIAASAAERRFAVAENLDDTGDLAHTIRLGLEALETGVGGAMFLVCDQPLLRTQSIQALCDEFLRYPDHICALGFQKKRGNPVIFPRALFAELSALPAGRPGADVITAHPELVRIVEVAHRRELMDVDYRADLEAIIEKT